MPYIAPKIVAQAREIDLLTYLKNYEPNELVEVRRNTYTTKSHDSLKISNGLWYWFTKGVGGKSAIDYLMKVKNYTFINAVQTVMGNVKTQAPISYEQQQKNYEKKLKIPISLTEFLEKNSNINEIHLHLDRDLAGRNASSFFQQVL